MEEDLEVGAHPLINTKTQLYWALQSSGKLPPCEFVPETEDQSLIELCVEGSIVPVCLHSKGAKLSGEPTYRLHALS